MSKLDDILRKTNPISSDKWLNESKQKIKDLMLELIGEDDLWIKQTRAELRQRVKEL